MTAIWAERRSKYYDRGIVFGYLHLTPLLAFLAFVAGFKAANASLPEGMWSWRRLSKGRKNRALTVEEAGSNPSMRTLKTMGRRSHKKEVK